MTIKKCQKCGRTFEGRANKNYCSSNCKSAMNNSRVAERDKESLSIHQQLNQNRRILKALYGVFGEQELPTGVVEKSGLNFQINTGRTIEAKGNIKAMMKSKRIGFY